MTRLNKMMFFSALIAVLFGSFSLAAAQTLASTPVPIDEANLAVISADNIGQLKSLGSLSMNTFYGFSPDSKTLFYTDSDGKLYAWDFTAGKISATIPTTHSDKYLSADTKTLIVINGSIIETWDTASAQMTKTVPIDLPAQHYGLTFSTLGKFVAFVDTNIYPNPPYTMYDTATGKALFTFPTSRDIDGASTFTPDDKAVLVSGLRGDMQFMDTTSGQILWTFHSDNVNGGQILFSPDGHVLAIRGPFGATDLVDTTNGKVLATIPGDTTGQHYSNGAVFSPDSQTFWLLNDSGAETAYDLTGKAGATIQADSGTPATFNFNADGSLVALLINQSLLEFADVASAKIVGKVTLDSDPNVPVYSTRFSPDGKLLMVIAYGSTITLWGIAG
ncbi:MAG: hypothetical protein ABI690_04930 [Chloroflexota bacterium]